MQHAAETGGRVRQGVRHRRRRQKQWATQSLGWVCQQQEGARCHLQLCQKQRAAVEDVGRGQQVRGARGATRWRPAPPGPAATRTGSGAGRSPMMPKRFGDGLAAAVTIVVHLVLWYNQKEVEVQLERLFLATVVAVEGGTCQL
jgi:hypothetical protein